MGRPRVDFRNMTPRERLELLEELWGSLAETPEAVPLSEEQRLELDRRLDASNRDTIPGIPWEEVLQRVRERRA